MKRPLHHLTGVFVALVATVCPTRTWSAEATGTDPEALIRQGVELRRQGQSEAALPFFERAYAAARSPRTAGQLGLSEMSLGYWLEAERHLGEALNSPTHPWVTKYRRSLSEALTKVRERIAEVSITGPPAGAEIRVNGHAAGTFPLGQPLRVAEGQLDIEVTAPDFRTAHRGLSVKGGDKQEVAITLEKAAPVAPPAAPAVTAAGAARANVGPKPAAPPATTSTAVASAAPASPPPLSVASPSDAPSAPSHLPAYLAGGAGILALGFGVIETFAWKSSQDSFNNHLGPPPGAAPGAPTQHDCGQADPMRGGTGCQNLYDDATRSRTLAIVGYAVGAALGATAIVLLLRRPEGAPSHQTAIACAPDPFARGVGCRWSF